MIEGRSLAGGTPHATESIDLSGLQRLRLGQSLPLVEGIKLVIALSEERDEGVAFQHLNNLCNWIIENQEDARILAGLADYSPLWGKVGRLDAREECLTALNLERRADIDGMDWFLNDYYRAETEFVAPHLSPDPAVILQIGHGALCQLALNLHEEFKKTAFHLVDIDDTASHLAPLVLDRLAPSFQPVFEIADIRDMKAEGLRYELCIISNAVLAPFLDRVGDIPADLFFIRGATVAGSIVYPLIDHSAFQDKGYRLRALQDDSLYGIHQWALYERAL